MTDVTGKQVVIHKDTFQNNTTIKVVDLCNKPFVSGSYRAAFDGCTNLEKVLNLNYDSPNIDMGVMFRNCSNLLVAPTIPDIVTSMDYMFYGCSKLPILPNIPDSITELTSAFCNCTSITTTPIIPRNVVNMRYTYSGCTKLSGNVFVQTKQVNDAKDCFGGTSLSKYVYIPFTSKETKPLYAWGSGSDTFYTLSSTPSVGDKILNADGSDTELVVKSISGNNITIGHTTKSGPV